MSRIQLALNVTDLTESIAFYSNLFNTSPAKQKPGYANFAIANPPLKLVLIENTEEGGTINHLGIEVETSDVVHSEYDRLRALELIPIEEFNSTCCYARQEKIWVRGPSAENWEIYTVLSDSETFGNPHSTLSQELETIPQKSACCSANPV